MNLIERPGGRDEFYIGDGRARQRPSLLRHRWVRKANGRARAGHLVEVTGDPLEHYARWLIYVIAQAWPPSVVVRCLDEGSTLAGACCTREAVLYGPERPRPAHPCHGDAIFSAWLALDRAGWAVQAVDTRGRSHLWTPDQPTVPGLDLDRHNAIFNELYATCYGTRPKWGGR